ncbi:unnamed protein product [Parascedosporium putredinis]|uniref:Uncharacterized protein n=1 Tax=Parascedosporium putredinis TaxID=1442378 RepID=A0A9P1HDI9_9PEZI|nr:unnamed protein product [Parascedosporium putredinis]CAI8004328.1 unnamed protein product [Parascedosporium putredinis]
MANSKLPIAFIGLGAMGFGMATQLLNQGYKVTGSDSWPPPWRSSSRPAANVLQALPKPQKVKAFACAWLLRPNKLKKPFLMGLSRLFPPSKGNSAAITQGLGLLQAMSAPEKLYIVAGELAQPTLAYTYPQLGKKFWKFQPLLSAVTIILKDTMIITSEARRCGFPTPMVSTAEQGYFLGLGRGFGADDDAGLIRLYTEGRRQVTADVVAAQTNANESSEITKKKIKLVTSLLKGIHLCSASECLAFAHRLGLPLDQTLELCVNAAGGSAMLKEFGGDLVSILRGNRPSVFGLVELVQEVREVVDEAHRLRVPLLLGNQALNIMRLALQHKPKELPDMPQAMAVKVWAA